MNTAQRQADYESKHKKACLKCAQSIIVSNSIEKILRYVTV